MQALVRLRGEVNVSTDIEDTLGMLNLDRVNHATLVPERDTYEGMIAKVNDYVAFGEPSAAVIATVIRRRGEPAAGDATTDDAWIADNTSFDDADALAEALVAEETTLQDVGLSPTLRLHPPRGGHEGVKNPVVDGGDLGRHSTAEIDRLLEAMR